MNLSIFSAIASWFRRSPAEAPRLILDGNAAWWPKGTFPLNVWIDGESPGDLALYAVRRCIAAGAPLLLPVSLDHETRDVFYANRDVFRNAIVVQPYVMTDGPGAFRCRTDLRYDKRSAELRNGLIEWNIQPGDFEGNIRRLVHELGHCCGLGHCDGTVMQERTDGRLPAGFNEAQGRYLKGLRG